MLRLFIIGDNGNGLDVVWVDRRPPGGLRPRSFLKRSALLVAWVRDLFFFRGRPSASRWPSATFFFLKRSALLVACADRFFE